MVEENGQQFSQMHMDGGLRESVFYFDFVEYLTEAEQALKIEQDQYASEVYLLHNGQLYARQEKIPVKPKVTEIAKSSVKALARKNTLSSIYRIYVQAMIHGVNFNIAFVPTEFDLPESSLEFDQKIMQQLFNLGHDMAIQGTAWQRQEAPEDPAERLRRIDPMEAIDPFDSKPKS
jgi:hypothetical protein